MTGRYLLILSIGIGLLAIAMTSPATAYQPPEEGLGYYLQGQEIMKYSISEIELSNGSVILLDQSNITQYLPQLKKKDPDTIETLADRANKITLLLNTSKNFAGYMPNQSRRIDQGDCVTLGETIDIAGTGWYTGYLVYFGPYYTGYSYNYNSDVRAMLKISARNLSAYYIDPNYFSRYPGWWYVYYDDKSNFVKGNDRLFYIGDTCIQKNTTEVQRELFNLTELYRIKELKLSHLPDKSEFDAEYIVSKNLTSSLPAPVNSRMWLFGRYDKIYDQPVSQENMTLSGKTTANWESGTYSAIYVLPDGNGLFDEQYDPVTESIISPFTSVPSTPIRSLSPPLVKDKLLSLSAGSYQKNTTQYRIAIQDPMIQVMRLDEWQGEKNTLMTLAGYTNANPGDTITIEMDKNTMGSRQSEAHTWSTKAWGNMTAYRFWNLTFAFDTQNENPGQHNMTISSESGGIVSAPFYIYRELAPHYIPENYIQYVNNSPFIPPVIKTVTVQVPGPTQYVYVQVTPSQESVNEAQHKVIFDLAASILTYIISAIIGFFAVRYLVRSWRRLRWHQK